LKAAKLFSSQSARARRLVVEHLRLGVADAVAGVVVQAQQHRLGRWLLAAISRAAVLVVFHTSTRGSFTPCISSTAG
jgi:hypothetical protein